MIKKLIFSTTIIFTVFIGCTNNSEQSQQKLKTGKEFYYKSKFDSSIVYLNSAIKLDTFNSEGYYFLSKANYQIENYKEALKFIEIAERKKYNYDSTDNFKLKILFAQENYDDFIAHCDKLIRKNTSNYKIYFEKSTALFNKAINSETTEKKVELLKEALDNVNISLKLNKNDNETYILRGAIRYSLSDYKGAIGDFDMAMTKEKKDSSILSIAYRYKGLTEKDLNNLVYAESLLDSAIIYEQEQSALYINRGDIRMLSKKLDFACDDYRKALEYGDNDAVDRIRANCK